jgi:enolase-phosphatase E1
VTPAAHDGAVRAVVLDVEGTTTPASFVYDVLFPYARSRLLTFLQSHAGDAEIQGAIRYLTVERSSAADFAAETGIASAVPPWSGDASDLVSLSHYLEWLMERDRKSTGLKIIQGEIWRGGFESGALRGEVYPDVKPALARWRAAQRTVAIYSSGSAAAQRLLFGYSTAGDLTPLIDRHFDTTSGPKLSADSYALIARELELRRDEVLFVSDVEAELASARQAGLDTRLCVRSGDAPRSLSPIVRTFDEL